MLWFKRKVQNYATIKQNTNLRAAMQPLFTLRQTFFSRKKPVSENYPFSLHDPFVVFDEPSGYENLALVGANWAEKDPAKKKPIAVLFGYNNWKLGFTADYLPEYRCAFAKRKIGALHALYTLRGLKETPAAIIVWGMNEPGFVASHAASHSIPLYRMEDGFVRSVALGASHSTPYSLVLDTSGIYYDPTHASDIETLFNTHDFTTTPELLTTANQVMELMREHRITKYNPPHAGVSSFSSFGLTKRVLVIGQVDNDASLRLGNPDGWTMEEMLFLAKQENPGAEILYRPHPDVYSGFQETKFKDKSARTFATIIPPDVPLTHILNQVDHIYTITSLAGFDALVRGVPVTTLGAPFYAGWGLTDDRCSLVGVAKAAKTVDASNPFARRTRTLTLTEMFAAAYLLYPRYLADVNDPVNGCISACYRIIGEVVAAKTSVKLFDAKMPLAEKKAQVRAVASSDDWPLLFSAENRQDFDNATLRSIIRDLNVDSLLRNPAESFYHSALILWLSGILKDTDAVDFLLKRMRNKMEHQAFNVVLDALQTHGAVLDLHYAWLFEQVNEFEIAKKIIRLHSKKTAENVPVDAEESVSDVVDEAIEFIDKKSESELEAELTMAKLALKLRDFDKAITHFYGLLIHDAYAEDALIGLVEIAHLRFDFASAASLASLVATFGSRKLKAGMHLKKMSAMRHLPVFPRNAFVASLFATQYLEADRAVSCLMAGEMMSDHFTLNQFGSYLSSILALDNDQTIEKAKAYISMELPEKAIPVLRNVLSSGDHPGALCALSEAYSYLRQFDDSRRVIGYALGKYKIPMTYREALRLSIVMNDGAWGLQLLHDALRDGIFVGEMLERKLNYVNRNIYQALLTLRDIKLCDKIQFYYPQHFIPSEAIDDDFLDARVMVLANFGPGDEIRFAQIYSDILADPHFSEFRVTCDPRLQSLFQRSFPTIPFDAVARTRENAPHFDCTRYNQMPGFDLHHILDNNGHHAMAQVDKALFATDLLAKYRTGYADFHGRAYLVADAERSAQFRKQLPTNGKPLVGLSWRSSLTTFSRNEHYLTIQELAPIFEMDGVQFVNLQYDECSEELAWVEANYPGKLVHLSSLDHYNDLDGVAALMKTMDLVISPATTVVELAGALGCPTWILSNSSELNWRKVDGGLTDIWHNSMTHLEGAELGNKQHLVEALATQLRGYLQSKSKAA